MVIWNPSDTKTFAGTLDFPVSAHPKIDRNGDLLFHSYTTNTELIAQNECSYFAPMNETDYVSFAHNLIFTQQYSIIWDCSVLFDASAMFDGGSYFRTKSDCNLRFGIIPKNATSKNDAIWVDTGGRGAVVHPLNSWEDDEDGTIVIWTPFCDNLDLNLDTEEINTFLMTEFRIDPNTGKVVDKQAIGRTMNVEFSVVPSMGQKIKFGYTAIQCKSTPGEGSFSGFCIWDMMDRKLHKAMYYQDGEVGGEPIIMTGESSSEVYIGVYTFKDDQTYFLLFEGKNGEQVARLKMPHRVPFGFHGLWCSAEELNGHFSHHEEKAS